LKWDAVGSILKQTKRKHQLTIKTCIKYVDKKSPAKIYKSPVVAYIATLSHVCNYKVQFCAFKGDAQNLPLRRVGRGRSP
jgi:cephalosporin-C deacetylase-like acetyl esterase